MCNYSKLELGRILTILKIEHPVKSTLKICKSKCKIYPWQAQNLLLDTWIFNVYYYMSSSHCGFVRDQKFYFWYDCSKILSRTLISMGVACSSSPCINFYALLHQQ